MCINNRNYLHKTTFNKIKYANNMTQLQISKPKNTKNSMENNQKKHQLTTTPSSFCLEEKTAIITLLEQNEQEFISKFRYKNKFLLYYLQEHHISND